METTQAMLATDMDGTIIPLEVTPEQREAIRRFRITVENKPDFCLAYVTGRDLPLAEKGIRQHELPIPDILVCDVGTSVYHMTDSGFQEDQEYVRLMEEARGGLDVRDVRHELAHLPELLIQVDEKQSASKLSYHLTRESDHQEVVASVHDRLQEIGGALQAVYSVGAPHGTGLLDVLPNGVAKDFAIKYLQSHTGVQADSMVYAGDSGNDLAAILAGYKAVVVGNATPGLKEELTTRSREMGIFHQLYFAQGFYVSGVMEGSRHFGLL
jgi:sucrose-6F-phosphate phosphohydrolase